MLNNGARLAEPGEFIVYIGGDSTTKNSASFTLE